MSRKLNVYLCGNKVGVLSENELLQLEFQYDDNARAQLSVNLPVSPDVYPNVMAFPFFENLTPEGEAFEVLTQDHKAGNKTFSILDRFGGDCAGAVAFYETEPDNKQEPLHEIKPEQFAEIIDKLPYDPLLTSMENPPRLSLAGAQSKFAVYNYDGQYYRSDDAHPTTHIIKITNKRFPNLLKNELFCMRLARDMQFDVPRVELKEIMGRQYLEIERYDRQRKKVKSDILDIKKIKIERIHQEDFCQALGIVSDKKYQSGGGADLRKCFGIIDKFSENLALDTQRFVEWIVFNYLIGNTDAHAKNISLLHTNNVGIILAPFYDLLSTEVYPESKVDHKMAMLINGKGKYDAVHMKDFKSLFEQLGLNATNMMKIIRDKFANIIIVAEQVREQLLVVLNSDKIKMFSDADLPDAKIYDEIINIIKKRFVALFEE